MTPAAYYDHYNFMPGDEDGFRFEPPDPDECAAEDHFDASIEPWFQYRLATGDY